LVLLVGIIVASAQTPAAKTGPAKAVGGCAVSHSGNNDTIVIKNCGVGVAEIRKMENLLSELLKDRAAFDLKADELLTLAASPSVYVNCSENSGNCSGINSGQQVITYNSPPVEVTTSFENVERPKLSPEGRPRATAKFYVNRPWDSGLFAVVCDRPCHGYDESVCSFEGYSRPSWGYFTGEPNIVVLQFNRQVPAATWCRTAVESEDKELVHIVKVVLLNLAKGQAPAAP
jgi:hypothetical protein